MPVKISLSGQTFSKLTVLRAAPTGKRTMSLCVCECGNTVVVSNNSLKTGNTKSCGCLKRDRPDNWIHGQVGSPIYNSWASMIQRCTNPNSPDFKYYGGRGITVCRRWLTFSNFRSDMHPRPIGLTLERRNNDGNYEPSNCIWATRKEQRQNRRDSKQRSMVS